MVPVVVDEADEIIVEELGGEDGDDVGTDVDVGWTRVEVVEGFWVVDVEELGDFKQEQADETRLGRELQLRYVGIAVGSVITEAVYVAQNATAEGLIRGSSIPRRQLSRLQATPCLLARRATSSLNPGTIDADTRLRAPAQETNLKPFIARRE